MCILPHQNKENWLSAHRPACVRNRTASVISSTLEISYHTLLSQFHLLIRAYSIFIFIFLLIFTNQNHLTETDLFISHEFYVHHSQSLWKAFTENTIFYLVQIFWYVLIHTKLAKTSDFFGIIKDKVFQKLNVCIVKFYFYFNIDHKCLLLFLKISIIISRKKCNRKKLSTRNS